MMTKLKLIVTVMAVLAMGFLLWGMGVDQTPAAPSKFYDKDKTYPAEALKEDLRVLWDVLDEGHAGLDRYTSRVELKTIFDQARDGITAPQTELDFYRKLLPLVAEVKDGHTRLRLSKAAGDFLDAQPVFFPFGLRFIREKAYVDRNLSSDPDIMAGAELLAINGMPVKDVISELLALIPNDAGIRTRKLRQLEFPENFGRLLAVRYGRLEEFTLRFQPYHGGETMERTVPGIKGTDVVSTLNKRYPDAARKPPLYDLSFQGSTAILTIRGFADDEEKGRPRYVKFLKDAFSLIARNSCSGLIIDLRGNGGGQDDYGKLLFAYVADAPFMYYRELASKKDRYDLYKYTTLTQAEKEEMTGHVMKNDRGWYDVLGHPNLGLQQPQQPHFAGRVAILIDGLSFSATGESTTLFHYHRKAVFFGEECGAGYYGNTSGFSVMVTLPNTGLQLRLPLIIYTMAVDGYPRDRGIVPEVPVAPTIDDLLAGRDPVMGRALKFLNDDEVAARLTALQADELIKAHAQDPHFTVLDVRTPEEFAAGHLKNAVNIDFRAADFAERLDTLDKNAVYLVYCRVGVRSLRAMGFMKDKGFSRVYDLEGGVLKWQEAGLPVIPEEKKTQPRPN
jgi:rhodanese-related sulfurtransferase